MLTVKTFRYPIDYTLSIIGGKWKCAILCHLLEGKIRTGEIRRCLNGISQKVLTQQLRELEQDGVIVTIREGDKLKSVTHGLSPFGETLRPIIECMCEWGSEHAPQGYTTEEKATQAL